LLFLSVALLYSAIAQSLGLSPLVGSFVAGVVLSHFVRREEVVMMAGIREVGLLLYFLSLGLQMLA